MRAEVKSSAILAVPLVVLAAAAACFWFDPAALMAHASAFDMDILRGLEPDADARAISLFSLPVLIVAGLLLIFVLPRAGKMWGGFCLLVIIAAISAFDWYAFVHWHFVIGATAIAFALLLVFAGGLIGFVIATVQTRAVVRRSFAGMFPKAAIEKIARDPDLLNGEGDTRVVTCASCNLRPKAGSGGVDAESATGLVHRMNDAMTSATTKALDKDGAVNIAGSDRFYAYWNAPLNDSEQALQACRAALAITGQFAQIGMPASPAPFDIEIGIATGLATAALFTANGRETYSVIGDCTRAADSLARRSGDYGYPVIVDNETCNLAESGFALLEVDFIALESGVTKLFAVFGNLQARSSPKFRALFTFHDHIFLSIRNRQWGNARRLIGQARRLSGASQKLYDLHLGRIDWYEKNPPDADWDGAFRPFLK